MPVLEKITVSDFRNIALQEISFSPNLNCFSGNNGEGKTNLLDAIYYLSMTKSAFSSSDKFNFRHGTSSFSICGLYRMEGERRCRFSIQTDASGEKKVRADGKQYEKVSAHIGVLPVVMVSPEDIVLVSESGEERRKFANSVLSQTDRGYLASLQQYNRLLQQRNRMLKDAAVDRDLLSVIDARMQVFADPVYSARKSFAEEVAPVAGEFYAALSGGAERIGINFRSDMEKGPIESLLAASIEKDKTLRYTSVGLQRDDFEFLMNGVPIRKCGSQGQQKSFLVSLKFAQYEIMKKHCGFAPLLLLDDVFDKLDMNRISNLLSMVSGNDFGQIFITDSNKTRMAGVVDRLTEDRLYFETVAGEFRLTSPSDKDI